MVRPKQCTNAPPWDVCHGLPPTFLEPCHLGTNNTSNCPGSCPSKPFLNCPQKCTHLHNFTALWSWCIQKYSLPSCLPSEPSRTHKPLHEAPLGSSDYFLNFCIHKLNNCLRNCYLAWDSTSGNSSYCWWRLFKALLLLLARHLFSYPCPYHNDFVKLCLNNIFNPAECFPCVSAMWWSILHNNILIMLERRTLNPPHN